MATLQGINMQSGLFSRKGIEFDGIGVTDDGRIVGFNLETEEVYDYKTDSTSPLVSCDFPTRNFGWALNTDFQLWTTNDGGITWGKRQLNDGSGTDYDVRAIHAISTSTFLVGLARNDGSGRRAYVYRYTNGGSLTNQIALGVTPGAGTIPIEDFSFLDASTGFCVSIGAVFKTTDGGLTWSDRGADNTNQYDCISMINNNTGWIGAEEDSSPDRGMYRTDNGGVITSGNLQGTINQKIKDVQAFNANVAYACGFEGKFWKTLDGGFGSRPTGGWNPIDVTGGTERLDSISFRDESTGVIGGVNSLYYTTDSGTTWTQINTPGNFTCVKLF